MIPDWASERREMVNRQLRARGVRDERVLAAMGAIPREKFVPPESRLFAYSDGPLAIGYGQTISQPYITALMVQSLALQGHEFVLDVGTGSGYHAAVLAALAERVISIEVLPELSDLARRNLEDAGLASNIDLVVGDGSAGIPGAMFDAISVGAGAPAVPAELVEQLRDPGRMVIPVGDRDEQSLVVIEKHSGLVERRFLTECRFVPLRGSGGWR